MSYMDTSKSNFEYDNVLTKKLYTSLGKLKLSNKQEARILGYMANYFFTLQKLRSNVKDEANIKYIIPSIFPLPDFRYTNFLLDLESGFYYSEKINNIFYNLFKYYMEVEDTTQIYFYNAPKRIYDYFKKYKGSLNFNFIRDIGKLNECDNIYSKIIIVNCKSSNRSYTISFKHEFWNCCDNKFVLLDNQNNIIETKIVNSNFLEYSSFFRYIVLRHKIRLFTCISKKLLNEQTWKSSFDFNDLFSAFYNICMEMNFAYQNLLYYYMSDLYPKYSAAYNIRYIMEDLNEVNQARLTSALNSFSLKNENFINASANKDLKLAFSEMEKYKSTKQLVEG